MKTSTQKLLALLLTLVMVVGLIPSTVLAINDNDVEVVEEVSEVAEEAAIVESTDEQVVESEEPAEEPVVEDAEEASEESSEEALPEEASDEEAAPVEAGSEEMESSYRVIASVVDGSKISVEGILPNDAVLNVKPVTYSDLISLYDIDPEEDISGDFVVAYDITILSQGYEYEPEDFGDTVTVSISALEVENEDEVFVSHVKDDATVEEIESVEVANGEVSFEAESFSIYVVSIKGAVNIENKYLKKNESMTFSINSNYQDIENIQVSYSKAGVVSVSAEETGSSFYDTKDIKVKLTATADDETTVTIKYNGRDRHWTGFWKSWNKNRTVSFTVGVGKDGEVSYNLTKLTSSNITNESNAVKMGDDFSCTLKADTNYSLPETIEVTMGGNQLVAGEGYTYNYITGELKVNNVINDVVITAVAGPAFTASYEALNHVTVNCQKSDIKNHHDFTAKIGLDRTYMSKFYTIPTEVEVTMGGTVLTADRYSYVDGTITVTNVTGDITIKAVGVLNTDPSLYTKTVTIASNTTEPTLLSEGCFGRYFSGTGLTVEGGNGKSDFEIRSKDKKDCLNFWDKHVAFITNFFGHGKIDSTIEYVVPKNVDVNGYYVFSYEYKTGVDLDFFDWGILNFQETHRQDILVNVVYPEFTLTLNANYEGADPATATQTVTYKTPATIAANALTRTGYELVGWSTTADGSVEYANTENGASYTLNTADNAELYAVWSIKSYPVVVKFELANGVTGIEAPATIDDKTLPYGTTYSVDTYGNVTYKDANNKTQTLIPTQAIPGYVFSAKTVSNGTVGEKGVEVTVTISKMKSNLNYFVALEKAMVYDKDKNDKVTGHSTTLFTESLKTVKDFNADKFNEYVAKNYKDQISNTHQYYLVGTQINDFFKAIGITADPMASDDAIAEINKSTGKAAQIVSALNGKLDTKQYKVVWNVLKYESDGWHIDGMIVDRNMVTVTYIVDGKTHQTDYYDKGENVTAIAKLSKTGFTFAGWFNEDKSVFTGINGISEDITVYGSFTAIDYKVNFDPNFDSYNANTNGSMADMTFNLADKQTQNLSKNTFSRSGYTFQGWSTSKDSTDVVYIDEASYTLDGENPASATLHAVWKSNGTALQGYTEIKEREEVIEDEDPALSDAPTDDPSSTSGEEETTINDEPVAHANADSAVTGDTILVWMVVVVLASLGIVAVVIIDRKEKE